MMNRNILISILLFFSGAALALVGQEAEEAEVQDLEQVDEASSVGVMYVKGAIGPPTKNYIERAIRISEDRGDELLVMVMDTPGGLLASTQEIIQIMLGSEYPVAVYVSPEGASAGSAGAFITLASHIAAMAPATNIGAASPVTMGGAQMDTVQQKKIMEHSISLIESIAEERGRNVEWARSAVEDGASITSREALEKGVIEVIARSMRDLLEQIHGKEIGERTLNTRNAEIIPIEENLAERFFKFILRPEVMLILTLVAIYGIVGELTNPGAIIPGVSGFIALILLLYGAAAMPINVAGFLLIALAIALFVIEAFTPTYGILLTSGAVAFFLGALMLFQDMPEGFRISLYWLIPATLLTVLFFGWILTYGLRAQFGEHRAGLESAVGKKAKVIERIDETGQGRILFSGEYWNAESDTTLEEGDVCEIIRFEGLKAIVKPTDNQQ